MDKKTTFIPILFVLIMFYLGSEARGADCVFSFENRGILKTCEDRSATWWDLKGHIDDSKAELDSVVVCGVKVVMTKSGRVGIWELGRSEGRINFGLQLWEPGFYTSIDGMCLVNVDRYGRLISWGLWDE